MIWSLLIVLVFSTVAFAVLVAALGNPDRWRVKNVWRWRKAMATAAVATVAAVLGAAVAGATGGTLATIAMGGGIAVWLLWLIANQAWLNNVIDRMMGR